MFDSFDLLCVVGLNGVAHIYSKHNENLDVLDLADNLSIESQLRKKK